MKRKDHPQHKFRLYMRLNSILESINLNSFASSKYIYYFSSLMGFSLNTKIISDAESANVWNCSNRVTYIIILVKSSDQTKNKFRENWSNISWTSARVKWWINNKTRRKNVLKFDLSWIIRDAKMMLSITFTIILYQSFEYITHIESAISNENF